MTTPLTSAPRAITPLHVAVVSDVVCPWCFIGKRRLEEATRQLAARTENPRELHVSWHPYELNPDLPREGVERKAYLGAKFGNASGGDAYARIAEAGRTVGLDFDFAAIQRTPNTLDAHRLLWFAGQTGDQEALAEALFSAFFLHGRDVGDRATLAEIAGEVGLDAAHAAAFLDGPGGTDAVRAEEAANRTLPTQGVPTYLAGSLALSGAQAPETFVAFIDRAAALLDAKASTPTAP